MKVSISPRHRHRHPTTTILHLLSLILLPSTTSSFTPLLHNPSRLFRPLSSSNSDSDLENREGIKVHGSPVRPFIPTQSSTLTETPLTTRGPRFKRDPPRTTGEYISQIFELPDKHRLGYDEYYVVGSNDLVLYLPNLSECKDNPKSRAVSTFCKKTSKNFLVADWFGRGESTGKLMEATLTRWTSDTIHFLDGKTTQIKGGMGGKKAVFVGSGVGCWVAVLVALKRPDLVRGIVGLSADPDFTEDLLWSKLPNEEKEAIMKEGFKEIAWGGRNEVYPITSSLIEDGRQNLVLRGGPKSLKIDCPVRLIHTVDDEEVPVTVPMRLAECIETDDVEIVFPKVGGHNLRDTNMIRTPWIDPEQEKAPVAKFSTIERSLYTAIYQCFEATLPYDPEQLMW